MKTFGEFFMPYAADATPEQMDSGELVKHVDEYPPSKIKKKKKKLQQKSFKEAVDPAFSKARYIRNPSYGQLVRQMAQDPLVAQGASSLLRFISNGKDVWTGHAYHDTHRDMQQDLGLKDDRNAHSGFITSNVLGQIRSHPKGFKGWVDDYRGTLTGKLREPIPAGRINELKIAKLYTVAPANLPKGEDLKSMVAQYGEKGKSEFKKKWDPSGFRGPGNEKYVHLTKDPLFAHAIRPMLSQQAGDKNMAIYDVRPSSKMDIRNFGGLNQMIKDRVPAKYIRKRWNDTKSKWINWNAPNIKEELADYEKAILKSRVIPALKHPVTGKIHLGKRGQDHIDLADSIFNKDKEGLKHYTELNHSGYYDPPTKKFYSRKEAGFDSSEIMTDFQRMRKYGTESFKTFGQFLNESKWDKYLYHATYADNFKPHVGMHVGTLHAAMARAYQVNKDKEAYDYGKPLHIHAFKYNTKGKSAPIIDHTDESGSPTEMITHSGIDVMNYLNQKKVLPKPMDWGSKGKAGDRQLHNEIRSGLMKKGITHLSYRNSYEDPGSTSHMIYDPENLQHVHTFEAPKFNQRYEDTDKPYFAKTATQRKLGKNP